MTIQRTVFGLALLLCAARAPTVEAMALVDPRPLPMDAVLSLDGGHAFARDTDAGGEELAATQLGASALLSLWRGERAQVLARLGARRYWLDTEARFPDTGLGLPARIDEVGLGLTWLHRREDGVAYSLGGGVEVAGDELEADADQAEYRLFASLRWPHGERGAWVGLLAWNSRSEILDGAPIPGIAYHWRSEPEWDVVVGIPILGLRWRPDERWSLHAGVLGGGVSAGVEWKPRPTTELALELGREQWRAWRAGRDEEDVSIEAQRWDLRLELTQHLSRQLSLGATLGYGFAREIAEDEPADRFFGGHDDNVIEVDPGPFAGLSLRWRAF